MLAPELPGCGEMEDTMKKTYEKPEIEITEFEAEDIMLTSGLTNGGDGFGDSASWLSIDK
jgi:hypothetical protein